MPDHAHADRVQNAERCTITELIKDQCAHCRGHLPPGKDIEAMRDTLLRQPGWIAARYPGTCCTCGERYEAGAAIMRIIPTSTPTPTGGRVRYMAECCAEDGPDA